MVQAPTQNNVSVSKCVRNTLKLEATFSTQKVESFVTYVSNPQSPHVVNAYWEADKSRLSFICLQLPGNDNVLALVDTGASISLICPNAARRLGLISKAATTMRIQGFHSASSFRTEVFALSLTTTQRGAPLTFLITAAEMPTTLYSAPQLTKADIGYAFEQRIDLRRMIFSNRYTDHNIDMVMGNDVLSWIGAQPTYKRYTLPTGRALDVTPLGVIVHPIPNLRILENPSASTTDSSHWDSMEDMFLADVQYATILCIKGLEPENEMDKLTHEVAQMRRLENLGIENLSITDELKKSTQDLIALFNNSVKFNSNGELEVAFPFNGNQTRLADNRAVATRRLQSLVAGFDGQTLLEYNKIFQDQLKARYIEHATPDMLRQHAPVYFIPHRAVLKEESLTTKVRVVLDASSHARGQISLNDCLYAGTNMIVPIFGILIRARCTRYTIVADIAKAFHQVRLQEEYRNSTCFLWLKDIAKDARPDNIIVYRSTVIPFGVASSPFLLAAYIKYHLDNNPDDINKEIQENLYVDNALLGTNDPKMIIPLITKSKTLFANMGMNLRDYFVNCEEVMNTLDKSVVATADTLKVLGYAWDRIADTWTAKVAVLDIDHPTKREVAAKIAETFDPLGFFTPLMVDFKRLLQKLWSHDMNWKDPIPVELLPNWRRLQESFNLETLVVPRQLTLNYEYDRVELLIFADASQDVYACLAYACFIKEGEPTAVQLLTSKNKIKPSKHDKWTIPKLELLAIECGSTLASNVIAELRIKVTAIRLFTDSACALFWILSHQNKRVWVANRIKKIQGNQARMKECGIMTTIHHCPTSENPADLATRGMTASDLQKCTFWFTGPEFLRGPPTAWPCKIEGRVTCPAEFQDLVYAELEDPKTSKKKKPLMKKAEAPTSSASELVLLADTQNGQQSIIPFRRTNSLGKLVRVVSLVLKTYTSILRSKKWETYVFREYAKAQCAGQEEALARCLIIQEHYKESTLQKLAFPPPSHYTVSKVDGLLRIRNHIQSPVLPAEAAEPIVIIQKHKLAEMLVRETHEKGDHMLESYVRSGFRTKYWIPNDTMLIRKVIRECFECRRDNGRPYHYPFSTVLPVSRTIPSKPFSKVGLDYLGPVLYLKDDGVTVGKSYVLIYTCLHTRGTVLRVVPDATSTKYVMTLKMIFREVGVPTDIYSDNAATFKLGAAVLNRDITNQVFSYTLTAFLASETIRHRYIVPLAPWQGGIYERIVGLVKHQIYKTCGKLMLDYHSLQYVVSGAQAMVNNRPLTPHARKPNDMIALRPMDFINPGVMIEIPAGAPADATAGCTEKTLRQHLNKLEDTLERMWKIWSLGYLLHLRKNLHKKRQCSKIIPSVGQVVLIDTELVPRHKWPMGVITKVNVSERDGEIRSAVVRCKGVEITRAVCLLIPLEVPSFEHEDATGNTDSTDPYKSRPSLPLDLPKASGIPGYLDSCHDLRGTASPDLSTAKDLSTDEPILPPTADVDRVEHSDQAILNLSTVKDLSTAKPSLPSPAVFNIEGAKYAPELFPPNTLPNIAEPDDGHEHTLTRENFNKNIEVLPTVGDDGDPTEVSDIPDDIVGDKYYVDPSTIQRDFVRASEKFSEGRSRAYLHRNAKDKAIDYVLTAQCSPALSHPSPRECCRIAAEMLLFDN